jgi:hypothetical protein
MSISSDTEREAAMRGAIEQELNRAAAVPGAASVEIKGWTHDEAEPVLHLLVNGERRTLEVSEPFLEDEPDATALRKVSVAVQHLLTGEAPRIQLYHRGIYAAWSLGRE